jgi:hypothetical protein
LVQLLGNIGFSVAYPESLSMRKRDKYKPAVTKHVLLCLAGIAWLSVGALLVMVAYSWLDTATHVRMSLFFGAGLIMSLLVHHFGFLKLVDKNVTRISHMDAKRCVFSFIPWKSYLIVGVMITMGGVLRHSTLPKQYLAIVYIGIGLALILSSLRYFRIFVLEIRR